MDASPSPSDIINAIKRSGYLMEQEVATQLESLKFHVDTNQAFEDVDEGKSREIDVKAVKIAAHNEEEHLLAFVEIIAECKNTKNPWVFIGRTKNQLDNRYAPQEFVFPELNHANGKDLFFHLGFDEVYYDFANQEKAVQFCQITCKGNSTNWEAGHGGLYDSIFYPMAKAFAYRKHAVEYLPMGKDIYFWWFVPMVITSGDIFYVDSMKTELELEPRDHVTFKRELQSKSLKGAFTVAFVRQKQLQKFISDCIEPVASRLNDLIMNRADVVLGR